MGKRGPKPEPTKLRLLRGNPSKKPDSPDEPQPPTDGVSMPPHLGEVAARRWGELLPMLQATRVMTRADVEALARYCDTWEWWLAVRAKLKAEGDTYPILNDGGEVKYIAQRPEVAIAHKLAQQLRQLESDFGLSPAARASLKVEPDAKAESAIDKFRAIKAARKA
ncbi:MAG: phage terminase small subunit P27 family [Caulobacteraceae bacterium]|nr:phage terminase small subunit P27 family [Caulobacteraceae bacterium]